MATRRVAGVAAFALPLAGAFAEAVARPALGWFALLDWTVGTVFAVAAMRIVRRDMGTAAVSLLVAATWFLGTLSAAPGRFGQVGVASVLIYRAPVLHQLARTRTGLLLTCVAYVAVLTPAAVAGPATAAIGGLIAVQSIVATRRAPADDGRRMRLSASAAAALAALWVTAEVTSISAMTQTILLDAVLLGIAWLVVRNAGSAPMLDALGELLVDLGPGNRTPAPASAVLARALGDPDLVVLYHPPGCDWVDEFGRTMPTPAQIAVYAATPDGGEVALVGRSDVLRESELARAAAASAGVAFASARLAAEARQRAELTRTSRRRLLEVGDTERKAIEERLHDGPLSRLALVREGLPVSAAMTSLRREIDAAIDELNVLAQGLYPAGLMERPLADVIRSLVTGVDPTACITITDRVDELDGSCRALTFFLCAECVTNTSRHAPGAQMTVHLDVADGGMVIDVTDDGPGGAETHLGGGLQGLTDRVATMGGHLTIVSPHGGPTIIRATVPAGDP